MTSKPESQRRKAMLNELAARQREELHRSLPLAVEDLGALIESLDRSLDERPCEHTLTRTRSLLGERGLDAATIVPWLNQHGGFCDCEVVANVSDVVEQVTCRPPLVAIPSGPKAREAPLGPEVDAGFGLTVTVRPPWRIRRGRQGEGAYVLALGRKGTRCLQVIHRPAPAALSDPDETWTACWLARNEGLTDRGAWKVDRRMVGPVGELASVTVSATAWTPALVWVFRDGDARWHLRFETELRSLDTDWRDLQQLSSGFQLKRS